MTVLNAVTVLLYFLSRWLTKHGKLHKNTNHRDDFSTKTDTVVDAENIESCEKYYIFAA